MSEPSDSKASPDSAKPSRRRSSLWLWLLLLFILLAVLALAGWGAWRGWQLWQTQQQAQQTRFHALSTKFQSLSSSLAAATDSSHANQQSLTTLQGRVDGIGHSVDNLNNRVRGGLQRAQMDEVEQLLLAANDAVQLAHSPVTAADALAAADQRLAMLDSPRLFKLRQAIAQERAALKAVHEPDFTAAALTLSQLIEQLPQRPLHTPVHALTNTVPTTTGADEKSQSWFKRGWQRIGSTLRSLFHLRRIDQPIQPMLTQAQAPLVGEVLSLRLDTARAALLQRNTALYRGALNSAQQWLKQYYRVDDPAVRDGLDQLAKLSALDLSPPLPDISHSLELLRALRDNPQD